MKENKEEEILGFLQERKYTGAAGRGVQPDQRRYG